MARHKFDTRTPVVPPGGEELRRLPSRKFVLLDLENLLFGKHDLRIPDQIAARPNAQNVLALAQARRPTDMVVVGCNPKLAFVARDLFPTARIVTAGGKDGADVALLNAVDLAHLRGRFSELCIVSGDHIFAPLARDARRNGLGVRVVGPKHGLSSDLRVCADTALLLPEPPPSKIRVFAA